MSYIKYVGPHFDSIWAHINEKTFGLIYSFIQALSGSEISYQRDISQRLSSRYQKVAKLLKLFIPLPGEIDKTWEGGSANEDFQNNLFLGK